MWRKLSLALVTGLATWVMLPFIISCSDDEPPSAPEETGVGRLCSPSAPESLLCRIEALYNDEQREVSERVLLYDDLFTRDFIFYFPPPEIYVPPLWGIKPEVEAHRGMFMAQDKGEIFDLTLSMAYDSAQDLDPPQPGREGWKEVFVNNVVLRLMFDPNDGLEVNGGQAEFLFPPPVGDRWYIAVWRDLPRPAPERDAVEPTTWGHIKAQYN